MDKDFAAFRLGGSQEQAARWIGISVEVFREWPERLSPVMADRVYAAIIRRETARALGMTPKQFFADFRGETVIESMLTRVSMAAVMASLMPRVPVEFTRMQEEDTKPRKRRVKAASTSTEATTAAG